MIIKKAEFIKSSSAEKECPTEDIIEFAFIGRSNVGKSSLINFLTGRKSLAKTSVAPGKTRLINHFLVNDEWYLVDLPGYGYAKVSKKEREKLYKLINQYIQKRQQLACLFVLVDSRHEPHQSDLGFINWLGTQGIAFVIVFTKTDKLSLRDANNNIKKFKKEMLTNWEEMPFHFLTSVKDKTGRDELLDFIEQTMDEIKKNKL